jgi:phosphatidylglycerol lysyltransferase
LCSLVASPSLGLVWPALGGLAVAVVLMLLLVRRAAGRSRWMPNLLIMGRFLFWCAIDLGALGMTLWLFLPAGGPSYGQVLPVFLVSLGLGVASGSPAGLGPFEAAMLTWLPQLGEDELVAGILMFRVMAYIVPALLGSAWLLLGKPGRVAPREAADLPRLTVAAVDRLPLAEAHLTRQGEIGVMAGTGGWLWLTGRLAHVRLMLGDPVGGRAAALTAVQAQARAEGRVPGLYKIRPRMAVLARRAGFTVVPVAEEAVLNPQTFTTAGPDRARLRRKLSHARKAGLAISQPARLPYDDMALVAQDWSARHGGERGFSMGRWDAAYVVGQRVVVARRGDALVGFVTFHAGPSEWVLDLVRFAGDAPDGTIYAMLCHALDLARADGVTRLSLAAIPARHFGLPRLLEPLLQRAFRRSAGLAQFKQAFAPRWEPRYMAARSWLALALVATETSRAILTPRPLKRVPYAEFLTLDGRNETPPPDVREEAA